MRADLGASPDDITVTPNWLAPGLEKTDPKRAMNDIVPITGQVPAGWLEALARSDAEIAAGLTVPADVVHRRIKETIARIREKRSIDEQPKGHPRD